jgi:hypothetical protein
MFPCCPEVTNNLLRTRNGRHSDSSARGYARTKLTSQFDSPTPILCRPLEFFVSIIVQNLFEGIDLIKIRHSVVKIGGLGIFDS